MLNTEQRKTGTIVPGDLVWIVLVNVFDEDAITKARKKGIQYAVAALTEEFCEKYGATPTSINMDSSDKRRLAEVINESIEEYNNNREDGTVRRRNVESYGDFEWAGVKYTSGCSLDLGKVSLRAFITEGND